MIPRIQQLEARPDFKLFVLFDDGRRVVYNVGDDIRTVPVFANLVHVAGLFQNVSLDSSRTVVYWNDEIDLASDTIYEYGRDC